MRRPSTRRACTAGLCTSQGFGSESRGDLDKPVRFEVVIQVQLESDVVAARLSEHPHLLDQAAH